MASPSSVSRTTTSIASANTTFNIQLDAALASGDLLIIVFRMSDNLSATTWPAGYQNYLNDGTNTWHDLDLDASDDTVTVIARDCDGTEPSSIAVTVATAMKGCAVAYRISGARAYSSQAPDILSAIGNSVNPDCPSESVTGGPKDILALALDTHEGEQTATVTYPTNYVNTGQVTSGTTGTTATNCQINYCDRQVSATSSENPSAFTISAAQGWTALTILVQQPATGDATATPSTVAATAAVPAPTAQGAASTSPATVAATAAVPAPTARSDNTASPATVAGVAAVPAPTVRGAASTSPSTVAATASVPAPTPQGAAVTSPATVAAIASVPAPTATGTAGGDATANPATVAALTAVPAPTAQGAAVTSPATVAGVAAVPAPTAQGAAQATPAQVAGTASVPAPTVQGEARATPTTVAAITTIPAPTGQGAGVATPATVAAVTTIPAPSFPGFVDPVFITEGDADATLTSLEGDSSKPGSIEGDALVGAGLEG